MGRDEASCRECLEREHGNVSAAAAWALQHDDAETALAIGGCLEMFWFRNGHVREGLDLLKAALSRLEPVSGEELHTGRSFGGPDDRRRGSESQHLSFKIDGAEALGHTRTHPMIPKVRARALEAVGFLEWITGDAGEARRHLAEALELHRDLGHDRRMAWTLIRLSNLDDPPRARRARLVEAIEIARRVGDHAALARGLTNLGGLELEQGRYAPAGGHLREAEAVLSGSGAANELASVRNMVAWTAIGQGDLAPAAAILKHTLSDFRSLGDRRGLGSSLHALGWTRLESGDPQGATDFMRQALSEWYDVGLASLIPYSLHGLACAAAAQGDAERAAVLFGAAQTLARASGTMLWRYETTRGKTLAARARAQLGDHEWRAAWKQGAGLSQDQAVSRA